MSDEQQQQSRMSRGNKDFRGGSKENSFMRNAQKGGTNSIADPKAGEAKGPTRGGFMRGGEPRESSAESAKTNASKEQLPDPPQPPPPEEVKVRGQPQNDL